MRGDSAKPTGPDALGDPTAGALPRVLGPFDAVAIVVGGIIGSGIFLKPGIVARELDSFGLIILVWIVVGLVTLCGALALAELAAMLPHAGGPYVYLREAFGRLPAFLWAWTELSIIRTGSIGALAAATAIYLNAIVPMGRWWQEATALGIVLFLSAVNVVGTRWGAAVQNLTTIAKLGFLAFIILLPMAVSSSGPPEETTIWPQSWSTGLLGSFGLAMVAVMWPYDGWINIAPVAEEIREPQRNVPLGLALGMTIVIVVYVLANVAYLVVLPIGAIATSKTVAHDVCSALLGEGFGKFVALGVACSTFGAANSNLIAGPRILVAMSRDGLLPAAIRRVHSRWQSPANAIWLQAAWATVLMVAAYAWQSDPRDAFDALTDFVIFGGSLFYALTVAAVIVLRRRHPEWPRPYRTLGYPLTPCIYLLGISAALVSLFVEKRNETLAGTALIAAGVVFYYWAKGRKHWQP
ncbi:MAG TPA: amino acid permease [Pirellulales bacterium]|nr:amino acid permease [Pirellulales bacterium]